MCKHCEIVEKTGNDMSIVKAYYCKLAKEKGMIMRCRVKGVSAECKKGEE